MRNMFANALFVVLFLGGCSLKNKSNYEEHYFNYRDSLVGLNEKLLKVHGVKKIENNGAIYYKKSAPRLSDAQVERFAIELKNLKVVKVQISNNIFDEGGYHLEYEVGRSGFVNHRIFYLVFNSKKEDIERLVNVGGCSTYSLIEGDWYLKELYDDGLC